MKKKLLLLIVLIIPNIFFAQSDNESLDLIIEKLENLENELARLANIIDSNSFEISKLDDSNQARYVDLDKRIHELEAIILLSSEEEREEETEKELFENPLAELIEKDGDQEEFNLWSNTIKLIDNSRYSEASENLRLLILSYPEGAYVADSYFWLGEIYYLQEMYEDASETYQSLISNFPDHERVSASLFKLGLIYLKLEKVDQAIAFFDRVILNYPKSGAAVLSEQELLKIND
jgi:tol-pal system protein YbgF